MRVCILSALFASGLALGARAVPPETPPSPVVPDNAKTPEVARKMSKLAGAYTVVSGERNGQAIPAAELKDAMMRFADGDVIGTDKDRKEFFAAKYTLDTEKQPWKITFKSIAPVVQDQTGGAPRENITMHGLAKKDADTVTVVYALPGGDTPTEFKTKDNQQMFVLKNLATAPEVPNKFLKE
jgi:uncharacterized protein (TIGR03067 family)